MTETTESIAIDAFIEALGYAEFSLKVREREPSSLDSAYNIAMRLEAFYRNQDQSEKERRPHAVRSTKEDLDDGPNWKEFLKQFTDLQNERWSGIVKDLTILIGNSRDGRKSDREHDNIWTADIQNYQHRRPTTRTVFNDNSQWKPGCFHCGQVGHFKRQCPQWKDINAQFRSQENASVKESAQVKNEVQGQVSGAANNHIKGARGAYIQITLERKSHWALLDTGGDVSIVPKSVIKDQDIFPSKQSLRAANGSSIKIIGEAVVPIQIKEKLFPLHCLVAKNVSEVILGLDWLNAHAGIWNFNDKTLSLKGEVISIKEMEEPDGQIQQFAVAGQTNPASKTDEYASQVQRVVTEVLDEVAPFKVKKKLFGQKRNLWLSKEAREAKKRRRRLERRWKRTGDENTRVEYRKTCRSTNRLITDSRKKYFSDKITQSDDSRGRWRIVKDLLHTNGSRLLRTADEARLFCNAVARFFHNKIIDIGTSIAARLTNIVGDRFSRDKPHNGTFLDNLSPVTIPEVTKIINSMPSKSSPLDYLPTSLLKSCSGIFAPIICNLANLSFMEGHFPDSFKMAQILPLLKKPGLDEESPASYRPISNLNTLSKILEKLFAARLKEHVRLSSNTNVFQSAYRQFHSTETALLRILNDFYTSIDGKKITILVSLDLSAAFDTLDHSTMLHRLEHTFGVSGPALLWISTYLAHRTHYVRVDDASSDVLNCNIGVPQGSVLGPLLFALYVAPVSSVLESHRLSHHQYADDTQLYIGCASDDLTNSLHLVNMCTSDLNEWFLLNGLCLNPDKSEAVFLGTSFQLKKCRSTTSLLVADKSISVSHDVKSLGVVIDEELSFDTHVDRLCQSAQYHIRALRHIRHSLSSDVAKTIACSIVGSRIDYCNSLLYGISDKNITKIQKVQNTVARVVSGHRKFDRITPVLRTLHWLPIKNRIKFKYGTIIFKTLQNSEPVYLRNLISHKPDNGLRSDAKCLLNVPPCKTVLASRAFTVAAPTVWNEIPLDIRKCTSLSNFKLKLKTHFFNLSFNS